MAIDTRTPAEIAVAAEIDKQIAAGGDPFGDDEPIVAVTIADQAQEAADRLEEDNGVVADADADEPQPGEVTGGAKTETPAEAKTETPPTAEAKPAEPQRDAPQFKTADLATLESTRTKLVEEKAAAFQKVMDGEIDPAAYAKLDAEISGKLDTLLIQRTLAEANAQTAQAQEDAAIGEIMESAKQAGSIDYFTDAKAQRQFDTALTMIQIDPDNAKRPFAALVKEAHSTVLALRGIATAAAAPALAASTKPAARTPDAGPPTLRGLPNASLPNTGGTVADALGRLSGAEYQAAFAKLTPAQKAAMLDE